MEARIVVLPGDGIGEEIIKETHKVLNKIEEKFGHNFTYQFAEIGGSSIDKFGSPLTDETLDSCRQANAILLGAVGGPKWDNIDVRIRPEKGLLKLRKSLGLFANLRPVKIYPSLASASPIKPDRLEGIDILVIRELTSGIYFGQPRFTEETEKGLHAVDTMEYYDFEVKRIAEMAFNFAAKRKGKVTSVDKANVLDSSRLWRKMTSEVAKQHPDIELEHMLVDSAAMNLISRPSRFDVLLTSNMFGDILTDEASVISGSMGLLPSASIGAEGPGLYEPIHGSAPDIAGQGIANPIGTILSSALMLRYSLNLENEARCIEDAVEKTIKQGHLTVDLGGKLGTTEIAEKVLLNI